jgi:regulatory protein YycI of two-component signal transduction system YycFG
MNYKFKKETAQNRTTIFWIVLVLLSLWLGWDYQSQNSADSYEQYPTENNIIRTKNQDIKVSRIFVTKLPSASSLSEARTAKGKYLILEVDTTNTSNKTDSLENSNLEVKDNKGRVYEEDFSVEQDLMWKNKNKFDDGSILPGMTNKQLLVYAVLEDAQGMTLTYEDSWGIEKYTIPLTQ